MSNIRPCEFQMPSLTNAVKANECEYTSPNTNKFIKITITQ